MSYLSFINDGSKWTRKQRIPDSMVDLMPKKKEPEPLHQKHTVVVLQGVCLQVSRSNVNENTIRSPQKHMKAIQGDQVTSPSLCIVGSEI